MKKSVKLEKAKEILSDVKVEDEKINAFEKKVREALESEPEKEKNKNPKEYTILLVGDGDEVMGYALQIPEGDNPNEAHERVIAAANDFNQSRKGSKTPVSTLGEALQNVPPRFFVTHNVWVKTKELVFARRVSNKLEASQ